MKTFLVQIEKFDTLTSIREKMEWGKGGRILLIWPKRGKIALSAVEIDLIKREGLRLGSEVAFVCSDVVTRELAGDSGISVFQSVPQAERAQWLRKKAEFKVAPKIFRRQKFAELKKKNTSSEIEENKWLRYSSLILGSAAILALLVFFIPAAKITVYPEVSPRTIEINIWASRDISDVNVNGSLPAREQVIQLSTTATAQSSGETLLASQYAKGEVIFHNISSDSISIPEGTIILCGENPDVFFKTVEKVYLEAGSSSQAVGIKAVQAGSSGNVEVGTITLIEGELGSLAEVTNENATNGGEDVSAPSPSEADYRKLKKELLNEMKQEAAGRMQLENNILIDGTLDAGTVTSEIRSVDVGTAADSFSLTLNVEFRGLTYSSFDLQTLFEESVAASLNAEEAIYGQGISILSQSKPIGSIENGMNWNIEISAETGKKVDISSITKSIAGTDLNTAKSLIADMMSLRQDTIIDISPRGWKILPWARMNIQIEAK